MVCSASHVAGCRGLIQAVQNIRQLLGVLGLNALDRSVKEEVLQTLVLEALDHSCNHIGNGCQKDTGKKGQFWPAAYFSPRRTTFPPALAFSMPASKVFTARRSLSGDRWLYRSVMFESRTPSLP